MGKGGERGGSCPGHQGNLSPPPFTHSLSPSLLSIHLFKSGPDPDPDPDPFSLLYFIILLLPIFVRGKGKMEEWKEQHTHTNTHGPPRQNVTNERPQKPQTVTGKQQERTYFPFRPLVYLSIYFVFPSLPACLPLFLFFSLPPAIVLILSYYHLFPFSPFVLFPFPPHFSYFGPIEKERDKEQKRLYCHCDLCACLCFAGATLCVGED